MLLHLQIHNFAVVSELDIEFEPGLTVITGETGAGKSITVDALGFILGNRADSGIVRHGAERCEMTATFDVSQLPEASSWLNEQDLESDENLCMIRRLITAEGRSRAFVNGSPVMLQQLKTLGQHLVDIHGQHEHQSLLQLTTHRKLLDAYAGCSEQAAEVGALFSHWADTRTQLDELTSKASQDSAEQQLLTYQLEELEALGLEEHEFESLEAEQKRLANASEILSQGQGALALCQGSERSEDASMQSLLSNTLRLLDNMGSDDQELSNIREMLDSASIQIDEAAHNLASYIDRTEINPERLQAVDDRLAAIYQLARKHQVEPNALNDVLNKLQTSLGDLTHLDDRIAELKEEVEQLEKAYQQAAEKLSTQRTKAAERLNQSLVEHLQTLDMPNSSFVTALTLESKPTAHGLESIEFLVSTNPGQDPRPLRKVASGGELSRISLALQVIMAQTSLIPTLIFDEVDVGIGGATAETVGRLLKELGGRGQVLCVTHQAQVAAQGHQHLKVAKSSDSGVTNSQTQNLEEADRIQEIARMLGGAKVTPTLLAHAEELINQNEDVAEAS